MDERNASTNQLTRREIEILSLLASGLSDREIADKLFLNINTIKWYNRKIYTKLEVCSRTQAVALAYQLQLLDSELTANNLSGMQGISQNDEAKYT
jgi:ATP/maltotriose-dependent transcriptional regulator MalT